MTLLENTPAPRVLPEQLKARQWKPGQSGNPGGRPHGSRNKLTETFIAKMLADFQQHGDAVIEKVRERNPTAYLACVAALVPKQKQEITSPFSDLTDEELAELEKFLKASRAKTAPPIIEAQGAAPDPPARAATHANLSTLSDQEISDRLDKALNSKDRT